MSRVEHDSTCYIRTGGACNCVYCYNCAGLEAKSKELQAKLDAVTREASENLEASKRNQRDFESAYVLLDAERAKNAQAESRIGFLEDETRKQFAELADERAKNQELSSRLEKIEQGYPDEKVRGWLDFANQEQGLIDKGEDKCAHSEPIVGLAREVRRLAALLAKKDEPCPECHGVGEVDIAPVDFDGGTDGQPVPCPKCANPGEKKEGE